MQNLSWNSRNRQRRKNKEVSIVRQTLVAIGRLSIPLLFIILLFIIGATLMPVVEDTEIVVYGVDQAQTTVETSVEIAEITRKERLEQMIREQAVIYGVDPDEAVWIAECESSLNERAANGISSAKGLYQFTDGTWEQIKAQGHQYDAEENIKQFLIWYPIHPGWWECQY